MDDKTTEDLAKSVPTGHPNGTDVNARRALQAEYVAWLFDPDPMKGTQGQWATDHGLERVTLWRWKNEDAFVIELIEKAEKVLERQWMQVMLAQFKVASDPSDMQSTSAATFLAKVYGKFAPERATVKVERVAYTQPGELQKLGEAVVAAEEKRDEAPSS